jgi:hypothetical protein
MFDDTSTSLRCDGVVQHLIAATNVDPHSDPKPDLPAQTRVVERLQRLCP